MFKLLAIYLGLVLTTATVGSIYDSMRAIAFSAKHSYQFDQISYAKFTKAMTGAKPRRLHSK